MNTSNLLLYSPLSLTHDAFVENLYKKLGRGREQASLIYREFFRTGKITGSHPAFTLGKELLKDILSCLDCSLPLFSHQLTEASTHKFLLRTSDGFEIESVYIPMQAGGTLCVSSQVGCRLGCTFCETGRMGLLRNLSTQEIVSQVFKIKFEQNLPIRNIVFMGMGEPLDNYDAVMQAVRVLGDPYGFAFGRSHITLSTSGRVDGIERLLQEPAFPANLAVSINAPNDAIRKKLMPINNKYSMGDLYEVMRTYCDKEKRQILIAYVLIQGINDALEHADELASYLRGLRVKVNLIPYNPQRCDRYQAPEKQQVVAFKERLSSHGYLTLLRLPKGTSIMAACGQLGNKVLRLRQSSKIP